MRLDFVVYGEPIPQGSTRAFIPKGWTRPIITAANAKTKPWRQEMAGAALSAIDAQSFAPAMKGEPVGVTARFFFGRPKSVKAARKTTKPDVDKLLRAVLDSLQGIAFRDDAQVDYALAKKQYGEPARVVISVEVQP